MTTNTLWYLAIASIVPVALAFLSFEQLQISNTYRPPALTFAASAQPAVANVLAADSVDGPIGFSRTELCKAGTYTTPSAEEKAYMSRMNRDKFVIQLRKEINDFLSGNASAQISKILTRIPPEYLSSKFTVVETDIAPGGGESILLIFNSNPDRVFYAWVYAQPDTPYEVRALHELHDAEESDIVGTQKELINQICLTI
jgi:hypothetical protein